MSLVIDITLLTLLAVTALAIVRLRGLLAAVMLAGIYSFLAAGLFTYLDAVDVAMTEAAVGAGISTVLFLLALTHTGTHEADPGRQRRLLPLVIVIATGACLVYATLDMPDFGEADNPIHQHVVPRYLEATEHEIGIPNVVTAVLASYRGYDTMGEVAVVFTAAVGVLLLLGVEWRPRRRRDGNDEAESGDDSERKS